VPLSWIRKFYIPLGCYKLIVLFFLKEDVKLMFLSEFDTIY